VATKILYEETYDTRGWFDSNLTPSGWFDRDLSETSGAPPSVTGQIKVYDGSFVAKPVKVWTGVSWETKPVKYYNGSTWMTTNY